MKRKIILSMMFALILMFNLETISMAALAEDSGGGGGNSTETTEECEHKSTSWETTRSATCTTKGKREEKCNDCGEVLDTQDISARGHTGGSYRSISESEHARTCTRCGEYYDEGSHNNDKKVKTGNKSNHSTYCSDCGKYQGTEAHDHNIKIDLDNDDVYHETGCSTCGEEYVGKRLHETWIHGENSPHTCADCGHIMDDPTKKYHQYSYLSDGCEISRLWYRCELDGCGEEIRLTDTSNIFISGLPIEEYAASDATINMPDVPQFKNGTYTLVWQGSEGIAKTRDSNGDVITTKIPEEWVTLYGWKQRNLHSHVDGSYEATKEYYESFYADGYMKNEWSRMEDMYLSNETIDAAKNIASEKLFEEWIRFYEKWNRRYYI